MKTKVTQNIKSIILALILVAGVGYVSASTWTNPTATPPGNNTDTPINVGGVMGVGTPQTKTGDLSLAGILTAAHLFTSDLTVTNPGATITAGQVLAATDSTGKVGWVPSLAAGLPVCGPQQVLTNDQYGLRCVYTPPNTVTFGSTFTWNVPAGITRVAIVAGGGAGYFQCKGVNSCPPAPAGGLVTRNNIDVRSIASISGTVGDTFPTDGGVVVTVGGLNLTANNGYSGGTASGGDTNVTNGNSHLLLGLFNSPGQAYVTITYW